MFAKDINKITVASIDILNKRIRNNFVRHPACNQTFFYSGAIFLQYSSCHPLISLCFDLFHLVTCDSTYFSSTQIFHLITRYPLNISSKK